GQVITAEVPGPGEYAEPGRAALQAPQHEWRAERNGPQPKKPTGGGKGVITAHNGGGEGGRPARYQADQRALSSGAEYAELDIRKTRDDVLVCYHDEHAGRGGPPVSELSRAELCERAGYDVPGVAEVMRLLGGKLLGHLDLKETGYEK